MSKLTKDETRVCIVYSGFAPNARAAIAEIVTTIRSYEGNITFLDDAFERDIP